MGKNYRLFVLVLAIFAVSFFVLGAAYGILEEETKTDETSGPQIVGGKILRSSPAQTDERKKTSYAPGRAIFKLKSSISQPKTKAASSSAVSLSELPSNLRTLIRNRFASAQAKIERAFKHQAGRSGDKSAKTQALPSAAETNDRGLDRVFKLKLDPSENIESLCRDILLTGEVEYCEPDYLVTVQTLPNDTYVDPDQNDIWTKGAWGQDPFNSLHPEDVWGLKKIKATEAWNTAGNPMGEGVVVAVTDTGVDYKHEDLTEDANVNGVLDVGEDQNGNGLLDSNIWINPGEIPNNGIDDDGNGYIDDTKGWDFITFDGTAEDNDPMDDHGHGTHVSGTIAAIANNNRGISGVAPKAKIMALKGLNQNGSGSITDLSNAILYAADNGAHVINASWGGQDTAIPQVLMDAMDYAHDVKDVVFVAAAGNSNQDVTNAYFGSFFPASFRDSVTVSAFDSQDQKAYFSNFGVKIDVAAPGGGDAEPASAYDPLRSILSLKSSLAGSSMTGNGNLIIGTSYLRQAGTSMAAPHVSGVAALIRGLHPEYSAEQVRQVLRKSSDDIGASGFDIYSGYGRVNAFNAVNAATPLAVQIAEPVGTIIGVDQVSIKGTVNGPGLSFWNLEYGTGEIPSTWTQIAAGSQSITNNLLTDWDITTVPDGTYTIRLRAQNTAAQTFEDRVLITIDQIVITEPVAQPLSIFRSGKIVNIQGTVNPANFESYFIQVLTCVSISCTLVPSANVTLANGGLQRVRNGLIAAWDTTGIPSNFYIIRLNVRFTSNGVASTDVKVGVDPTLHEGWPIPVGEPGFLTYSFINHLNSIDLDRDGAEELLIGYGNNVQALNHMGQNVAGWPQAIDPGGTGIITQQGVTAGDVDGDGLPEVTVGTNLQTMFLWDSNGNALPGWPKQIIPYSATLAIEDIDGDGTNEFISSNYSVSIFDKDGSYLAGWPRGFIDGPVAPPAIGDVDGDGKKEILTMGRQSPHNLYLLDHGGDTMSGWPKPLGNPDPNIFTWSFPLLADVDGDGDLEIIAPSVDGWVHVFNHDGSYVQGWPQFTQPVEISSVTVGDIDGDGNPEIIAGTVGLLLPDSGPFETRLYAWHGDGTLLAGWPVRHVLPRSVAFSFYGFSNVALADVNGDYRADVVAAGAVDYYNPFPVHAYQFDGTEVSGFPKPASAVTAFPAQTPAVSDVDGDGLLELSWVDINYRLYMWDLEAPANAPRPWPMFMHDPQHTGRYTRPNSPPEITSISNYGGQVTSPVQATVGQKFYWTVYVSDPDPGTEDIHQLTVTLNDGQTITPVPICGSPSSTFDFCYYRAKTIGCDCNDNETRIFYPFYLTIKPEWAGKSILFTFTPMEALPDVNPGTPVIIAVNVGPTDTSILADMQKVIWDHLYGFNPEVPNPYPGFDLNGDGNVTSTDVILMRNIWTLPYEQFIVVRDRFMSEVSSSVGTRPGDPRYILEFDVDRNGFITAAADRGRILTALNHGRT